MQSILEIDLVIHDLAGGASEHYIDEYLKIYKELLPQYFHYAPVMRQRAQKPIDPSAIEQWHQWLLTIRDRPVGMIEFLYNRKRNTGLLLDFAIHQDARAIQYQEHERFAGLILRLAMRQLVSDAQANRYGAPLFMVTEVEFPTLVKRYAQYGFVEFPIEYFEPPFTPGLADVSAETQNIDRIDYKKMYLGAFQIPGRPFNPHDPEIVKIVLRTLWEDHYRLSADHWLIKKFSQEIHV